MRGRTWTIALALLALPAGCTIHWDGNDQDGDDDDIIILPDARPTIDARPIVGANPGVVIPNAVTAANVNNGGTWTEIGPADWSCLGTPSTDQPSSGPISLSGRVEDFQTGNPVGAVVITAWSTSPSSTLGTVTSSNVDFTRGEYALTLSMLPAGTRRYSFTLTAPSSYVATRVLQRYYPPGAAATEDFAVMSEATATALPAFIGVDRDPTKGLVLGTVVDCQGRTVSNAVAGISMMPGSYVEGGGITFYFSAGSTSLPVRHNVSPLVNKDGLFVVLDALPDVAAFVQVWGFRTQAELQAGTLTLLAEIPTQLAPDTATTATFAPRRN